jgi:hypothetical protein
MAQRTRPCERCGAEIPAERIEVLPDTRLCVKCSTELGGEFRLSVMPENLAKSGSIKKNYGSFAIQKTRKPIKPSRKN